MFVLSSCVECQRAAALHFNRFIRRLSFGRTDSQCNGILAEYHRRVTSGCLQPDGTQLAAVQALQLLQDSLAFTAAARFTPDPLPPEPTAAAAAGPQTAQVAPPGSSDHAAVSTGHAVQQAAGAGSGRSAEAAEAAGATTPSKPRVQGAYLWGPVGSGKTMLMDMFLNTLPQVSPPAPVSSGSEHISSGACTADSSGAQGAAEQLQLHAHRVHYHEFMLAVHERLHQLQQSLPKIVTYSRAGLPVYRYALPPEDPLLVIARDTAAGIHLLCLDELHVTDVADAMLLSRLFGELLHQGCMVMFTSNRPARDLYKGGLSRKYFEPFIGLIDERLLQLKVAGGRDYRSHLAQQALQQQGSLHRSEQQCQQSEERGPLAAVVSGPGTWFLGQQSQQLLQQHWQQLQKQLSELHAALGAAEQDKEAGPVSIELPFGRRLWIPKALVSTQPNTPCSSSAGQQQQLAAAYFTFEQICGHSGCRQSLAHAGALSATDHLALVKACPVIFIQLLPQLTPQQRDEARRLVTLVDILYEAHTIKPGSVKLYVSAAVTSDEVFLPLLGAAATQGINPNLGKSEGKLNVQQLVQEYGSVTAAVDGDKLGAAAGEAGSNSSQAASSAAGATELRSSLLPEEVLMYHRASSRLTELCAVVQAN